MQISKCRFLSYVIPVYMKRKLDFTISILRIPKLSGQMGGEGNIECAEFALAIKRG